MTDNNKTAKPEAEKAPAPGSTPIQAVVVIWGEKEEDLAGTPFQWGRPLLKNPMTIDGTPCPNHGSIMVYGVGPRRSGVEPIYCIPRGIGGLYDFLSSKDLNTALAALGLEKEEIATIAVAPPLTDPTVDPVEARLTSRRKRRQKLEGLRLSNAPAAAATDSAHDVAVS